ncbi:MAG: hypothetical protein L3J24_04610 [Xanthomonadales bacterium]|nr:hypothetical protein [Xanthomonadales bacterium]
MHTELLSFLNDGDSKNGEFISLGIDSKLLLEMQAASNTFMQEQNPSLTTHPFISTLFERLYFSASFNSKGVVFKHDQVKK